MGEKRLILSHCSKNESFEQVSSSVLFIPKNIQMNILLFSLNLPVINNFRDKFLGFVSLFSRRDPHRLHQLISFSLKKTALITQIMHVVVEISARQPTNRVLQCRLHCIEKAISIHVLNLKTKLHGFEKNFSDLDQALLVDSMVNIGQLLCSPTRQLTLLRKTTLLDCGDCDAEWLTLKNSKENIIK